MKIGWIGLGQMGLPTAKKLAAAGHTVSAYDVKPPTSEDADGLSLKRSAREAAADCDLLCIAVFSDAQVEEVLTGADGVMEDLNAGAVVAIFTTGSIESVQKLAASARNGIEVLDTCFSRMQAEISTGMLTLLVGGNAGALDRVRPAFAAFARTIFHVGGSGAGRAIKLVNNILFAGHLQLGADALRLAEALGLERAAVAAALVQCSGSSDIISRFVTDDPAEMLTTAHRYMVKDVTAAIDAGRAHGVELGALAAATATYQ